MEEERDEACFPEQCGAETVGEQEDESKIKMWDLKRVVRVCHHYYGKRIIQPGLVEILDRRIVHNNGEEEEEGLHVYYDVRYLESDAQTRENNISGDFLCEEPIRRSFRLSGTSAALERRSDVQALFDRIKANDLELAILRTKQHLDATVNARTLMRLFALLADNTSVQALYLQNLENGMNDTTLAELTKTLRKNPRIWALNVGENFQITKLGWERFAMDLRDTCITHLYAGSESTVNGELKVKMRDAIRDNRTKHNWHCSLDNLHVIQKIGQMWWNPKNAAVLKTRQVSANAGDLIAIRPDLNAPWQLAQVEARGEVDLMHELVFLSLGARMRGAERYNLLEMVVDGEFQLGLAHHALFELWWPCIYFARSGFLAFCHAKSATSGDGAAGEEGQVLDFEPCECREQDYILPFDMWRTNAHLVSNPEKQEQHKAWLAALRLCEARAW